MRKTLVIAFWLILGSTAALAALTLWPGRPERPDASWSERTRTEALVRARVWRPPAREAEILADDTADEITCRFKPTAARGTTPKFDCVLSDGSVLRVKYGQGAEPHAEVAATRLARLIGFPADRARFVRRLHCVGCPFEPFRGRKLADLTHTEGLYRRTIDYASTRDFEWVAVETRAPGESIETAAHKGWALYELNAVTESAGGAPRAHVDALRLFAVFLAHWDNKPQNQRLVCAEPAGRPGTCAESVAFIHDLGATFGPHKLNLRAWEDARIWRDRAQCLVDMKDLPYSGGTFGAARISEGGRRLLADGLLALDDEEIAAIFRIARFDHYRGLLSFGKPPTIAEWVTVFQNRVREIAEGPPCPSRAAAERSE